MDVENGFLQEFRLQAGRFPFISISVMEIVGGIFQDFTRTTYSCFLLWNCVQDTSFPHAPSRKFGSAPIQLPARVMEIGAKEAPPQSFDTWNQIDWVELVWQTIMSWGGQFLAHKDDESMELWNTHLITCTTLDVCWITKPPPVLETSCRGMIVVSFSPASHPLNSSNSCQASRRPHSNVPCSFFQNIALSIWAFGWAKQRYSGIRNWYRRDLLNVTRHLIGLIKLPKLTVAWLLGWLLTYAYLLLLNCRRASTKQHSYRNLLYPSRPASLKAFCKLAGSVNFWGRHECPSFLTHG